MNNTTTGSTMNTGASKLPAAAAQVKSAVTTGVKNIENKLPSFGGISIPELAVIGAAGYLLWRNRSKIQILLEDNNIAVPAILSGDFSELLQKGASALGGKDNNQTRTQGSGFGADGSRKHDA